MKIFFHEDFYQVYTSDPAAAAGRMEAVVQAVKEGNDFVPPRPASEKEILLAHTRAHVEEVRRDGLYSIASLAAGAAVQTADTGMTEPVFGLIRPPGHHASAGSCWGFCYFNNMAVAVLALRESKKIETAYILDIDMHFGDGTDNILSRHNWVTVHNVETRDRKRYLQEVEGAMEKCRSDVIGISAGFDNHKEDWGGVLLTADYEHIGHLVKQAAIRNKGGCFALLEGGYNHHVLGQNALALIQGMSL